MTSYTKCNKCSNNDIECDVDSTFFSRSVLFIFFRQLNKFRKTLQKLWSWSWLGLKSVWLLILLPWPWSCSLLSWPQDFWMMTSYSKFKKNSNNDDEYDLDYTFESPRVFIFFTQLNKSCSPYKNKSLSELCLESRSWLLNFFNWLWSCSLWSWLQDCWLMTSHTKCNKDSNNDDESDVDYTFESRIDVFIFVFSDLRTDRHMDLE